MSEEMKGKDFDRAVEPLDWRYSAAIVGLEKYLQYLYHFEKENKDFEVTDDYLKFRSADITEEKYLEFVEYYYDDNLQHRRIEHMLRGEEFSEDQKKAINDLMQSNAVSKKVFGKIKFNGENKEEILTLIKDNRQKLIKETYGKKNSMYADFVPVDKKQESKLLQEKGTQCRLVGYYVDPGRKSRAVSYNFNVNTFVGQDDVIFDFIPFAFIGDRESFFINDSFSVKNLIETNRNFEHYVKEEEANVKEESGRVDTRKILFKSIQEVSDFLNYDVEIIYKNMDRNYFETMYIRKESIKILKSITNYEVFCNPLKINDDYIFIQERVLNCILNLVRTDYLIELCLKNKFSYVCKKLIELNVLICGGGEKMKQSMRAAYACAKEVANKIPENKINSYRQKLISSIVFKDYDRCCQILLQLSNYSDVTFNFAYDLFEDFEENKDVAYTFINALTTEKNNNK